MWTSSTNPSPYHAGRSCPTASQRYIPSFLIHASPDGNALQAAMYEGLASFGGGPPNEAHCKLYEAWGRGGWGMVITGSSARYLSR